MAFFKRAAAISAALAAVALVLVGAHAVARRHQRPFERGFHSHPSSVRSQAEGLSRTRPRRQPVPLGQAFNFQPGNFQPGNFQPGNFNRDNFKLEDFRRGQFLQTADQRSACDFCQQATHTIHADAEQDSPRGVAGGRTADLTGAKKSRGAAPPLPLPDRTNALPVPSGTQGTQSTDDAAYDAENSDKFGSDSPAARKNPSRDLRARRIIDKELPDLTPEEREVWHEMLKDIPPADLRELLRVREQFGRLPGSFFEIRGPQTVPLPLAPNAVSDSIPKGGVAKADLPRAIEPLKSGSEQVIRETLSAIAQARQIIVRNIANANTPGYKREIIFFESGFQVPVGKSSNDGKVSGVLDSPRPLGARLAAVISDVRRKNPETGRPLDLAIEGEGFFQVTNADVGDGPVCYTRCGRFSINAKRQLVLRGSKHEWLLLPSVTIPAESSAIQIGNNGRIESSAPAASLRNLLVKVACIPVGGIQTARFALAADLVPLGENVYAPGSSNTVDLGEPGTPGHGKLREACLEESNVDLKQELDELERLQKVADALQQAASLISSPATHSLTDAHRDSPIDRKIP